MSDQSIAELYGQRALPGSHSNWKAVVGDAVCPYLGRVAQARQRWIWDVAASEKSGGTHEDQIVVRCGGDFHFVDVDIDTMHRWLDEAIGKGSQKKGGL